MRPCLLNLKDTGSSQNGLCASPSLNVQFKAQPALNYLSHCRTIFLKVSLQCLSRVPFAGHLFLTAYGGVAQDATRLAVVVLYIILVLGMNSLVSVECLKYL